MNRHFPKIKVHLITLIYFLICIEVGWFKESLMAFFIVLVHEYAHTITAMFFHYDIQWIHLYPFGAFVELSDYGLHENHEDFLVALMGPLSFIPLFILGYVFKDCLGLHAYTYFQRINIAVLCFNLLPIYPLDGSKLLLVMLSYCFDYLVCLKMLLVLSFLGLIILTVYCWQLGGMMMYVYLANQLIYLATHFYDFYRSCLLSRNTEKKRLFSKLHYNVAFYKPYNNYYLYEGQLLDEKEFIYRKIFIDNDKP